MLLRTAIGWHFLYEGVEKIYSLPEGRDSFLAKVLPPPSKPDPPFTAEGYLRASTGPLAPYFRSLVPDVDSLEKLNVEKVKASWKEELERYARHYNYDEEQLKQARAALADREAIAENWFRDPENVQKIGEYKRDLAYVDKVLADPASLAFERERAYEARRELESSRRELANTVDSWTKTLRDSWRKTAGDEATERVGPPPALRTQIDWINYTTMGGLVLVGLGLMLGLLTPLAALGGAAYLALFYFSMPPWPHIPPGPNQEGHYLIVNKNLIELLACLVLASTPNGLWIGLDAILFGRRARRRAAAAAQAGEAPRAEAAAAPTTTVRVEPAGKTKSHK